MANDDYKRFVLSAIEKRRRESEKGSGYVTEKLCENCGNDIYGRWYLCNSCYRKLMLGKS